MARQRRRMALKEMMGLSFQPDKIKPVLKNLLELYDNKWEFIEAENYRVLVDAILESDKPKEEGSGPSTSEVLCSEETDESPSKRQKPNDASSNCVLRNSSPGPPELCIPAKLINLQGSNSNSNLYGEKIDASERTPSRQLKKPKIEPDLDLVPVNDKMTHHNINPIQPKREPLFDELAQCHTPVAVVHPHISSCIGHHDSSLHEEPAAKRNGPAMQSEVSTVSESGYLDTGNEEASLDGGYENRTNLEIVPVEEQCGANFVIASSSSGEVKLSLSCESLINRPGFHVPNIDAALKLVEDKCLKSCTHFDPGFSIVNLMKEFCQSFFELATKVADNEQEEGQLHANLATCDSLKIFHMQRNMGAKSHHMPGSLTMFNGSPTSRLTDRLPNMSIVDYLRCGHNGCSVPRTLNIGKNKQNEQGERHQPSIISSNLGIVQNGQYSFGEARPLHDVNDVCKGEETVKVSIVNEVSSEECPPSFHYIPHNIIYQNAYVNFSLARIGDEDCCPDCYGDCLTSSVPCACARETGGEFAYTLDGRVRKEFLDECISMNRTPHKHQLFYCKSCPLERSKSDGPPEPCKGHLVRKFIKECWSKCGCSKQCGNRVVQRGITCNLQVFMTSEGKGWGLRSLEELSEGTFVCEYVGEILTNTELYDRNRKSSENEKHTYPVLLDADWGSEGVLKDEEALCLDATFYGNVARFVNHRCFDATLVEIPVEVETPDHHYYHLAFFTRRKVEPFEELTWDYGIDFDDLDHPVKAFKCCCGSKYCRDVKHLKKSKRSLSNFSMPPMKATALILH